MRNLLLIVSSIALGWLICATWLNQTALPPIPEEPTEEQSEAVADADAIAYGSPRSSKWPAVREEWILEHPTCAACGAVKNLHVHHIKPFHLHPELELDRNNLITLCREHHFRIGHDPDGINGPEKPNWKKFNQNVIEDCKAFTR